MELICDEITAGDSFDSVLRVACFGDREATFVMSHGEATARTAASAKNNQIVQRGKPGFFFSFLSPPVRPITPTPAAVSYVAASARGSVKLTVRHGSSDVVVGC